MRTTLYAATDADHMLFRFRFAERKKAIVILLMAMVRPLNVKSPLQIYIRKELTKRKSIKLALVVRWWLADRWWPMNTYIYIAAFTDSWCSRRSRASITQHYLCIQSHSVGKTRHNKQITIFRSADRFQRAILSISNEVFLESDTVMREHKVHLEQLHWMGDPNHIWISRLLRTRKSINWERDSARVSFLIFNFNFLCKFNDRIRGQIKKPFSSTIFG